MHERHVQLVVTRTPLRISFVGGGTDLPSFYQLEGGAVVSTSINKYIYVTLKRHGHLFNENYRLNYSETENVASLEDIRNTIARECLRRYPLNPPVYVSTVADVPAFSGLGSSSAFAVGLLSALHTIRGECVSNAKLAEEASHIEIDVLKRPIGKQDQYATAIGGLNYLRFQKDHRVAIEPQHLSDRVLVELNQHLLMFWTDLQRDAGVILEEQNREIKIEQLRSMRRQADRLRAMIRDGFRMQEFAQLLSNGWELKRQLASGISTGAIDAWYRKALGAGALGGKLLGAGGGGFLLFVVPPSFHAPVRKALSELKELPIAFESYGTQVLIVE